MSVDSRRIAVSLCAIAAFLHLYAPQAVLPMMAQEFGVGAAQAGMVIATGTLAVAATAPFTGAVADVLGRKRVICTATLLLLIPSVMVATATSFEAVVFWRFVQGMLFPPIFAVAIAYIGDEWPANEATGVVGLFASASAVGGFLARFIPGAMAAYVGWRGGFLTLAAMTAVCFVLILWLLPKEKQFVPAGNLGASLRQMLGHLRNPKLIAIYAVGFGVLFNFIGTFTYLGFHLAAPPFNKSAGFLGSIFLVYLVGSAASLWTGSMVSWLGRRRFMLYVLFAWAGGLLLTLTPSIPLIVAGLIVFSICGVFAQAVSTSTVAITAQGGTSSAVGLYVTAFYIGGTFGGWLTGLVFEAGGWPATCGLILAMMAIMAATVATAWKH